MKPENDVLDQVLLGDNQFFGINHMSEERARQQSIRFNDVNAVIDVIDSATLEGVNTFMCTTHEKVGQIAKHVRQQPDRYGDFKFYPCMPYAHKYADAVTELGIAGAIRRFVPDEGVVNAAIRGSRSLASRDLAGLATLLIDSEMKMFKGLRTPVIFLQNVVVDLLLGLGLVEAFRVFSDHIRTNYGAESGFITMNLPMLLDSLATVDIKNPIVCSNINMLGFRMSGGLDAYERALREYEVRAIAMSVFASGAIEARTAIEWVCSQPNISSIVFGASSQRNIRHTRSLVAEYWGSSR